MNRWWEFGEGSRTGAFSTRYTVTFTSNVNVAGGYYLVTPGLTGTCAMVSNAEEFAGNAVFVGFIDWRNTATVPPSTAPSASWYSDGPANDA